MTTGTTVDSLAGNPVVMRNTYASSIFRDILPNLSVRDGFSRRDYNAFRPDEAVPTEHYALVKSCLNAAKEVSIIKNIITLMVDFTIQGIHLVHPNKRGQQLFQEWWKVVNGTERSERFVTTALKTGFVSMRRVTAQLSESDVRKLRNGYGVTVGADINLHPEMRVKRRELPVQYIVLNPLLIDCMGDDLAVFANRPKYCMTIPPRIASRIKNPQNEVDGQIVAEMPRDVVDYIRAGGNAIPLDPQKVQFYHYRKDDWEKWGDPMIACVLKDLVMLEKMKLADIAALDGAISHIRVWKLGRLDANFKIIPTRQQIDRLAEMLINNVGGGAMDLIWGPDIDLLETKSDVYQFLGQDKYVPVLNAIYSGLGIPAAVSGMGNSAGFTNNYISLRTLVERLNYIRMMLVEFWEREINFVQKSLGILKPARVRFQHMSLSDEAAEKNLLLQMADRNIMSYETVLEHFGETMDLESLRLLREDKLRDKGRLPRKSGPWNDPEHPEALEKIALQTGVVTPSEVGLDLDSRKDGQVPAIELKQKQQEQQKKGQPGQGRPQNSKDKKQRKQKRVLPRTVSEFTQMYAWARKVQKLVSDTIDPVWLATTGKKNMRSLTDREADGVERLKFAILCSFSPNENVTTENVLEKLNVPAVIPDYLSELVSTTAAKYLERYGVEPSIDIVREIQASAYALDKGGESGEA